MPLQRRAFGFAGIPYSRLFWRHDARASVPLYQLRCVFATDDTPSTATRIAELTVEGCRRRSRCACYNYTRARAGVGQPIGGTSSVTLSLVRVPYGKAGGHAGGCGRPAGEPEGVRDIYAHGATTVVSARYNAQTCPMPNNSYFFVTWHFYIYT